MIDQLYGRGSQDDEDEMDRNGSDNIRLNPVVTRLQLCNGKCSRQSQYPRRGMAKKKSEVSQSQPLAKNTRLGLPTENKQLMVQ